MGVIALISGFIRAEIPLIVLRALTGAGSSFFSLRFLSFAFAFLPSRIPKTRY
jgi:hypothetical protein